MMKKIFVYAIFCFILSSCEDRTYHEKIGKEIGIKLENEFKRQKIDDQLYDKNIKSEIVTYSPLHNGIGYQFFIPNYVSYNKANILYIFDEIYVRENINLIITFYDNNHKEYIKGNAKKIAEVKYKKI
ncbi:MAG: hypothetical protein IK065_03635 [Neisseriaceae bacterium]|nr:hypothetical protein [Neisseriaceae bacterium]